MAEKINAAFRWTNRSLRRKDFWIRGILLASHGVNSSRHKLLAAHLFLIRRIFVEMIT